MGDKKLYDFIKSYKTKIERGVINQPAKMKQ